MIGNYTKTNKIINKGASYQEQFTVKGKNLLNPTHSKTKSTIKKQKSNLIHDNSNVKLPCKAKERKKITHKMKLVCRRRRPQKNLNQVQKK